MKEDNQEARTEPASLPDPAAPAAPFSSFPVVCGLPVARSGTRRSQGVSPPSLWTTLTFVLPIIRRMMGSTTVWLSGQNYKHHRMFYNGTVCLPRWDASMWYFFLPAAQYKLFIYQITWWNDNINIINPRLSFLHSANIENRSDQISHSSHYSSLEPESLLGSICSWDLMVTFRQQEAQKGNLVEDIGNNNTAGSKEERCG